MKRALVLAILIVASAFVACVRDVELHPPLPDADFGPDGATPDAGAIPSDALSPDA